MKRSESMNDSLSRKQMEYQIAMTKEEWIDFNQSMIINPYLKSFSNLLATFQQNLFLDEKRPPKNRFCRGAGEKPHDVGRHFLKVHLKKCFNHALHNSVEAYDCLSNIHTENQIKIPQIFQQQMQSFIFEKLKEFNDWLENLRKTFKDYNKDDFKAAYLVNHKILQGELFNLEQNDVPKFLNDRSKEWDIMIFKMALRQISLNFIRDASESGLRFQLKNAPNITIEAEHQRYVTLTEWLIEKPSRIDYSEIYGKRWAANFFESREKDKGVFSFAQDYSINYQI
jgi:hypothetical protein